MFPPVGSPSMFAIAVPGGQLLRLLTSSLSLSMFAIVLGGKRTSARDSRGRRKCLLLGAQHGNTQVFSSLERIFYRTQVSLGSDLWVRLSQTEWATLADLTDVTLAGEDINSIPTDNADRAFQGNVAMQVTQPGVQLWNQAMQMTSPNDKIWNQFGTNQNACIQKKYKFDFKKYCKS